jgi:nitrogenase molybdenum-iron protein alpha/beta subunit
MKILFSEKISCYASDTAGVCSALFELGGMTVVHDASGCNSTYATHDEPRWFYSDSMTYISAVTENDLVCGNDRKLVDDVVRSARELKPRFIALCNSPIPLMVGVDMQAIAREIEKSCCIPCFAVRTSPSSISTVEYCLIQRFKVIGAMPYSRQRAACVLPPD